MWHPHGACAWAETRILQWPRAIQSLEGIGNVYPRLWLPITNHRLFSARWYSGALSLSMLLQKAYPVNVVQLGGHVCSPVAWWSSIELQILEGISLIKCHLHQSDQYGLTLGLVSSPERKRCSQSQAMIAIACHGSRPLIGDTAPLPCGGGSANGCSYQLNPTNEQAANASPVFHLTTHEDLSLHRLKGPLDPHGNMQSQLSPWPAGCGTIGLSAIYA